MRAVDAEHCLSRRRRRSRAPRGVAPQANEHQIAMSSVASTQGTAKLAIRRVWPRLDMNRLGGPPKYQN